MRKVLLLLAGVAVLSVPAVSVAGGLSSTGSVHHAKSKALDAKKDKSNPATICRSKDHGTGSNAFGKCVSTIAEHQDESASKHSANSASEDSNESEGRGTAKSDGNHTASAASPATTCKAMQSNDLTHFEKSYGTRPNAFGKCVSGHANSKKS